MYMYSSNTGNVLCIGQLLTYGVFLEKKSSNDRLLIDEQMIVTFTRNPIINMINCEIAADSLDHLSLILFINTMHPSGKFQ